MSDRNPPLNPTVQPLTGVLRLTRANINTDQAAASLLTGRRAPAVQSPPPRSTSVPFDHPQSKDPNVKH